MLALYARLNNTTTSDAYWEIGEALCNDFHRERPNSGYEMAGNQQAGTGSPVSGTQTDLAGYERRGELKTVQQAERASGQEIHQTLSLLLAMLPLQPAHRNHLHSPKRGLPDEQIDRIGFKSTPPPFLCRSITERLMKQGCKVEGVPGFYLDDSGRWTMNFYRKNAGILIPAVGYDGMIHGLQILLDSPLKQKDDPPDKSGAKYIWFSSSSKNMGVTSGSPVHFIGHPSARVVYVIEGLLKADISHCLTNRTFAAIAGANNTSQLDTLFALLAQNGTEEIIEAHDMDKRQRVDQIALLDMALRFNPDIIVVGEMRGPEANAAQEAARTGVAVVTTIHSMSCEATYRRMVSLCKRAVDMSDETLMGFVTEAYPIIAFCKQLENKERRLMEIMECEILADGTRRYRPLFQYQITENRVEDGKFVIVGHHRQINPISDSLARRLMENGMPQETLAGLLNVKKDREGENG